MLGIVYVAVSLRTTSPVEKWILQFPEEFRYLHGFLTEWHTVYSRLIRWIFSERIAQLILGSWGLVFLCTGMFHNKSRRGMVYISLGSWSTSYITVIATGNAA